MNRNNEQISKEEIYRSLVNLKRSNNTNFDTFVRYLIDLTDKIQKGIAYTESECQSRWEQGKLQILYHILSDIENAERELNSK